MFNIEELRKILGEEKLHIGLGIIKQLHLADDRSFLKVTMNVLPENREVVATMTWDNTGTDSGDFEFPSPNDLVLFAQPDGDDDLCYVIRRLTSKEDTIPQEAIGGDKVSRAKSGKKYWNVSDSGIYLSRNGTQPTENVVLGQVFKTFASDMLTLMSEHAEVASLHTHIGNLGFKTAPPIESTDFAAKQTGYELLKASPIDDEEILSDLTFTEK